MNFFHLFLSRITLLKRSLCFLHNQFILWRSKVKRFKQNQISQNYGKNAPFRKSAIAEFSKISRGTYLFQSSQIWNDIFSWPIHCVECIHIWSFLICIFPHSDWIRKDALRIRTLFTQWYSFQIWINRLYLLDISRDFE